MRTLLSATAIVLAVATAAAAARTIRPTILTADGRIGSLRIDVSTRSQIVAATGRPEAERIGAFDGSRRYRALGYECSPKRSELRWPLLAGGPSCRTVFFLDPRGGRLGTFFTTSSRFVGAHGVRIGMPTATAERLLHRHAYVGCEENIYLRELTVAFIGGRRGPGGRLIGGHVYAFAMDGRRHGVRVFDCL